MFEEQRNQLEQTVNPSANPQQGATGDSAPELQTEEAKQLQAVADLSKFEKIKLGDEELSLEELKKQRMLEADYRRKTHELAEQRRQHEINAKFDVNFRTDLEVVMQEPWRAAEFYKVYPPEYHAQVKRIEQMYKANPSLWASDQGQVNDPRDQSVDIERLVEERISQALKPIHEKEQREQQKLHLAKLDAIETKLSQKYEFANKSEVYASAEYLSRESAEFPNGRELTDADWEKIYKDSHDRNLERFKAYSASQINKQKATNQKLKDVPGGGGVPGEAPVVPRSIKDATALWAKSQG